MPRVLDLAAAPRGATVSAAEPLPALLDCRGIMLELGVKRATAEAIMRAVPTLEIPGLRKSFARRVDVLALLDACTYAKDEVPAA